MTDTPQKTAAIVLAAGTSTRFGRDHKLLANLNGVPVIHKAITALKAARMNQIILVTGFRHKDILSALEDQEIFTIHNPNFESGMAASLAVGVGGLKPDVDQCFICLADMPFTEPGTYRALIAAADQTSAAQIFVPTHGGKRGNPVLWRKSQFHKLQQITGDTGGKSIIKEEPHLVLEVPVDDGGILIDLDTPEALAQFSVRAAD